MTPLFIDTAYFLARVNRRDQYHSRANTLTRQYVGRQFVVMRERGITEALTTDHHFTQAGFRALIAELQ